MRKLYIDFAFVGAWCLLAGCGSLSNVGDRCSDINPCKKNDGCQKDGTCVPVDAFILSTDAVGDATVGMPWGFELRAEGGIKPYAWYLETSLPWIEIDSRTGILSGTPDQSVAKAEVTVTVVDNSYGEGQSITRTLLLTVSNCTNDSMQTCFEASQGICFSGVRQCVDAVWSPCDLSSPSSSKEHCGPSCGLCDSLNTDACEAGACVCGSNPACQEGHACCRGGCADLETDLSNCGACGHDCDQLVQNVINLQCLAGQCQYSACDTNHLDCDQNPQNGCETTVSNENCGGCDVNCGAGSSNHRCLLDTSMGAYRCGCFDAADCGENQQCCGERCLAKDDNNHCGDCYKDCANDLTNHQCLLDGASQQYFCGCQDNPDCGSEQQCCDQHCLPNSDDAHCGSCGLNCASQTNNKKCMYDQTLLYYCGCDSAEDCNTDQSEQCCGNVCRLFSDNENCGSCGNHCSDHSTNHVCLSDAPSHYRCGCNEAADCGNSLQEQCCDFTCLSLADDAHCGDCSTDCTGLPNGGDHCADETSHTCGCRNRMDCDGNCCYQYECLGTIACP